MPTYQELLAQHTLVNDRYAKLFAANKAITKRLQAEAQARTNIRKALHAAIGPLQPGTLVMTHKGTRFYELLDGGHDRFYRASVVYQTNGERKQEKGSSYMPESVVECGSVVPVPHDHAVYLKYAKRRMRDTLEGKT